MCRTWTLLFKAKKEEIQENRKTVGRSSMVGKRFEIEGRRDWIVGLL